MTLARYLNLCPNCGGPIDSDRLEKGLPCSTCLPTELEDRYQALLYLESSGRLKLLRDYLELNRQVNAFNEFFKAALGTSMWSAQRLWAKRIFKGKSFAVIAPTGSGKTTFGILMALYKASKFGERCLIVLPTSLLVEQVYRKTVAYASKLGLGVKVVCYHAMLSAKEKAEAIKAIEEGRFDVLIVTTMFISRNFELLSKYRFDFIFVDDVDSFLKATSKNIDRVLLLLGIPKRAIELGEELIRTLKELRKVSRIPSEKSKVTEYQERVVKLREEIRKELSNRKIGILVVSGALARARRTLRVLLFREFLGFDIGSRMEYLRNIVDTYTYLREGEDIFDKVLSVVRKLGSGGLVFVPPDQGKEFIVKLCEYLNQRGIKAYAYIKPKRDVLDKFVAGEYDVLIGTATARSPLVRGIDLPQRVRYAVFTGVPKFKFTLNIEEFHPVRYMTLLHVLRDVVPREEADLCDKYIAQLRNVALLREDQLKQVLEVIKRGEKLQGFLGYVQNVIESVMKFVSELMSRPDVKEKIAKSPYISLREVDGRYVFIVPDVTTYIQASGRTSRLYAGGVSHGLSVLIVDDEKAFNALKRELSFILEEIEWKDFNEVNLEEILKVIDEERDRIRALLEGKIPPSELKEPMKAALLIVESPTKARTIARFFGRPNVRIINGVPVYEVSTGTYSLAIVATKGHIFDLLSEGTLTETNIYGVLKTEKGFIPIYTVLKRCRNCGNTFALETNVCPRCKSTNVADSWPVIQVLRELASEVDVVLIGTDPDAEGEKIAWDVMLALRPYVDEVRRIEFHEITKRAIAQALENPRTIDMRMVQAQLVRRIEDRWLGFSLSTLVQKHFGKKTLSAGRVQTPVLGWIIDFYRKFRETKTYVFNITLEDGSRLSIEIPVVDGRVARWLTQRLVEFEKVEVLETKEEEIELPPPPPYTTDSLLRDASQRLGIDAQTAMRIAQDLFELGLITYHRTDSTRVSSAGIALAKQYISENIGEEYFVPRQWVIGGHIGAHECIRPTRPIDTDRLRRLIAMGLLKLARPLTYLHYAVYDLVFRRFIASQMKSAKVIKQVAKVRLLDIEQTVERYVGVVEPGFIKVYQLVNIEKPLTQGTYKIVEATYRRTAKVYPLTQGEVIALMKERGIGRPSTYAKIVQTILERRYAITIGRRKFLIPTKLGTAVYEYLVTVDGGKYRDLVSEERTRYVLELMDRIERGEEDYSEVILELYRELKEKGLII
ncbi:MAG: reverse gyrase [Thermoprotei archaeon]|nr:MAG: reverse gyrase [Thermoprotei archaeon]